MAVTGWRTAGTVASVTDAARGDWTASFTAANFAAADGAFVFGSAASTGNTEFALLTNFGFSAEVPSGATIDGIEFELAVRTSVAGRVHRVNSVFLTKDGSNVVGTNQADTTSYDNTGLVTRAAGGSANLFGASVSRSEVAASTFGFRFDIAWVAGTVSGTNVNVDQARARIYYTVAGSGVSLTADAAAFTASAQAAGTRAARRVAGGALAATVAPQPAGVRAARRMTGAVAAFTVAPQAANLAKGRRLIADVAARAATPQDARLAVSRRLLASVSARAVAAQSATLRLSSASGDIDALRADLLALTARVEALESYFRYIEPFRRR